MPDSPDLVCEAILDWRVLNASSEEYERYHESIGSVIDYWLGRNVADPQNPDSFLNIPQAYDARPPAAASY